MARPARHPGCMFTTLARRNQNSSVLAKCKRIPRIRQGIILKLEILSGWEVVRGARFTIIGGRLSLTPAVDADMGAFQGYQPFGDGRIDRF